MQVTNSNAVVPADTTAFFLLVRNRLKFSMFLLKRLPAAYFSGLRILEANEGQCRVSIPFKWFTQNPFRSTYFACLSMAAEMSTGLLAMAHIYRRKPSVSMLVLEVRSQYHKKAAGNTIFTCVDGKAISDSIQKAIQTKEPQTITVYAGGVNEKNELASEFWITWSFKAK